MDILIFDPNKSCDFSGESIYKFNDHSSYLTAHAAHLDSINVLIADELSPDIANILKHLNTVTPALMHWNVVVSNDPQWPLQSTAFEMGLVEFWGLEQGTDEFVTSLERWRNNIMSSMDDKRNTLGRLHALNKQNEIQKMLPLVINEAQFDYQLAHCVGHCYLKIDNIPEAKKFFLISRKLNENSFVSLASLANLPSLGPEPEDNLQALSILEGINGYNPERKAQLGSLYLGLGDHKSAAQLLSELRALEPKHSKIEELQVRLDLGSGDVKAALLKLQSCSNISDSFLSKLNEEAIALAKAGKTNEALLVYSSAHMCAPTGNKYKVSYNIALAYKRNGDISKTLQYLDRSLVENPDFDKALKLKLQIKSEVQSC